MKNFQDSLNKWLNFHFHVSSLNPMKTTPADRKNYWAREIWSNCGFCDEFLIQNTADPGNCSKCPLYIADHCNVWWPNLGGQALMRKIRTQYCNIDVISGIPKDTQSVNYPDVFKANQIELLSLIAEFIKEMVRYADKFQDTVLMFPDVALYDEDGNEIGVIEGTAFQERTSNASK